MDNSLVLPHGYVLQGEKQSYVIDRKLGQSSFGITYLASTSITVPGPLGNIETEIKVAVKEFFIKEFSTRREDGSITEMSDDPQLHKYLKRQFLREAENLEKLSHPNIVNVLEVFVANNTCYYAMQYISGGSLESYVRQRGGLPEDEAIGCIRQIGEAVQYMHDHRMLHLDLKPGNVMRSDDGSRMVLIDFGLSRQYEENGPLEATTLGLVTAGYSPIEQVDASRTKDFSPTLDVYALGATFFKLLTGQTPPNSIGILDEGLPIGLLENKGVSQTSIVAIERAMEPRKSKRVQSVTEFLGLLSAQSADEVTRIDDEPTVPITPPSRSPNPHRSLGNPCPSGCGALGFVLPRQTFVQNNSRDHFIKPGSMGNIISPARSPHPWNFFFLGCARDSDVFNT